MTPRVAIYSAIYGDYEATAKPLPPMNADSFMFTDSQALFDQAADAGWIPRLVDPPPFAVDPANGDPAVVRPMLAHKWFKTHPINAMAMVENVAGSVDVSIWLDGSMQIKTGGAEFVDRCLEALGDDDWSLMPHPWRSCVYDEAVYSSTLIHRYDSAAMLRQHDAYLAAGMPRNWGLFATGLMVRRHTPLIADLGEAWWLENVVRSHQDQLSLPWVFWQYGELPGPPGQDLRWNTNLPWLLDGAVELHPHGA